MGGARQFDVLLRKNLLLKSRRPCATCFELSLPIVLFLLLAYIRSVYEIKTYGPYFFEQGALFPMSSSLLWSEEGRSQALVDVQRSRAKCTEKCDWSWDISEAQMVRNGRQLSAESSSLTTQTSNMLKDTFLVPALCGGQAEHFLASNGDVDKLLMRQMSHNETLKDFIMRMNTSEVSEELDQALEHFRTYNFDDIQNALTSHREVYLKSDAKRMLEELAARVDQEISNMQADIDKYNPSVTPNASANARQYAEDLVDDICSLRLWNRTQAAPWQISVDGWNLTVNGSVVVAGIVDIRKTLERGLGLNASNISAELRAFAAGVENTTLVSAALNETELQEELQRLGDALRRELNSTGDLASILTKDGALNSTLLVKDIREIADALERLPGASWTLNTTMLADAIAELRSLVESLDLGGNATGNASGAARQIFGYLANISVGMPWTAEEVESFEAEFMAWLKETDVAPIARTFDEMAWWLSHFLRSGSMAAKVIGESVEDWRMLTDSLIPRDLSFFAKYQGEIMRLYETSRTESGALLHIMLRKLQSDLLDPSFTLLDDIANMSKRSVGLEDLMNYLQGSLGGDWNTTKLINDLQRELEGNASQWSINGTQRNASQLNSSARAFIDRIKIEQELLPLWESRWLSECPKHLNKTAIGEKVEKTARGCPMYKKTLEQLKGLRGELRNRVAEAHRTLQELNATELREYGERWRSEILAFVNGSSDSATNGTRSVLERLQLAVLDTTGGGEQCLKLASQGCRSITDEGTCLSSRDGTLERTVGGGLRLYGEACVWCGGGPCTSDGEAKCAPKDWLLRGEGRAFASFMAKMDYRVASQGCGAGGVLGAAAVEALKASLGVKCPEPAGEVAAKTSSSSGGMSASSYMQEQLLNRKILVAPYKGDVQQLFDLFLVDLAQGVMQPPSNKSAPMYGFIQALMRCPILGAGVASSVKTLLQDRFMFMDSEAAVEDYARRFPDNVLVAIVFRSADQGTGNFPDGELDVEYAIRLHAQLVPSTSAIMRISGNGLFGGARMASYPYMELYFSHLQEMFGRASARMQVLRRTDEEDEAQGKTMFTRRTRVSRNIIANNRTEPARRLRVGLEQFPADRYEVDAFIRVIQHTLPMFMILGWIYTVSLLVKEIVYEKQERLRDVMRIMGLKTWVYWSSWFASALVQLTGLVLVMTIIVCGSNVLKHSNPIVVFLFFWLYSVVTVALSLLISSFFSRAKVAAACGGLAYYVFYMPYSFYNRFDNTLGMAGKNGLCLLSSTGFGIGMAIIAKWELVEIGLQWDNLFTPPPVTYSGATPTDSHSMGHVLIMFLVDTWLYLTLAWYVEKVYPGTLGLPQPFYFPLMPSYWFPKQPAGDAVESGTEAQGDAEQKQNPQLECWEAAADGLDITVRIRQLAKTFRNGKQALRGISLDMQEGTIVGLLGHNGAGKSTTMSILTGLYPPTAGDVTVNGVSVTRDSHGVRRQLGVCLQHNALYENITVQEHLRLFCCLKSVPWADMPSEIDGLLRDVGLAAKKGAPTRALSGGMKRKLSICIALSGGSRVVTLDEPTAGVDATSRRDIWHLLAGRKAGRTTLLSTHFMDEADILSDRIAIIGEGRLTAIGSSLALKRKFAEGYMLTVVVIDGSDSSQLTAVIAAAVPGSHFVGGRGRELSYILPFESRSQFAELFKQLQDDKVRRDLGVDAYGLSAPTMEEVFLQASSMHEVGLHGRVRNDAGPAAAADEASSTAEGSSSDGSPAKVEESSVEAKERAAAAEAADRPRSPQCMEVGATPRAAEASTVDTASPTKRSASDAEPEEGPVQPLTGTRLWLLQFDALFRKRALSVRRDRKAWASQLLLPACFVLAALIIARVLSVEEEEPPIKLTTDMFVGTIAAGSVTNRVERNDIRVSGGNSSELAGEVQYAFTKSAGAHDNFVVYDDSKQSFAEYFMMNSRSLQNTFGAVSMYSDEQGEAANVTLWFNNGAYHAIPVMTNLWNNARFHMLGFDSARTAVWSHPLPKTQALLQEEMTGSSQVFTDLTVAITVILAMGFVPASFVVYLVHEKASSGKHQQLLTGITPVMYWVNSFAWDMVNFFVPLIVCFIIFMVFQVGAYSGDNSFAVFLLLLLYGLCMTPCMYCVEPLFKVPSTAYVTLIVCNIFTGTISTLAVTVMDLYKQDAPELGPINEVCKALFPWLLPNYCLGRGLLDIAVNHYLNFAAKEFGVCPFAGGACSRDPLVWDVAGRHLTSLAIMAPCWFALRLLIEWGFCLRGLRKRARNYLAGEGSPENRGDRLVLEEQSRVEEALASAASSGGVAADHLVITDLAKTFPPSRAAFRPGKAFHAVRGITVGVPAGECFGLLGVNGAGKTTTMRMITGDTDITRGDIFIGGWSVQNNRDRARQHLGYCPQFDALPDKLTVRETLALYARIRGVPPSDVKDTVARMVSKMCLENHQTNLCENLSGGNKRKLSTALALIGSPDVVLLDEPSTGVDVGARRFLWEVIGDIRKSGHAVVLTSHSMEECEVLCTRLTIMVHGQFRCLGSPTELKSVYGGGYTMAVKANLNRDQFCGNASGGDPGSEIRSFVEREVPCARLTEESVGLFRYKLGGRGPASQVPLADIFQKLEQACGKGGSLSGAISDYSLSQTSLEEVFLHFSQVGEREYAQEHGAAVELPTAGVVLPVADDDAPALPQSESTAINLAVVTSPQEVSM